MKMDKARIKVMIVAYTFGFIFGAVFGFIAKTFIK
jgi:hypothetical protein